MASTENLTIVVPVLNEAASIELFCNDARRLQQSAVQSKLDVNFIFVDNGSTDSSYQMLKAQCEREIGFTLLNCKTRGYGAALKTGFRQAMGDYIGFIDLDGTYPMQDFLVLAHALQTQPQIEMAVGSRMNLDSKMPIIRKIGNTIYTIVIQFLYLRQIPDACSGMRLIRKDQRQSLINQSNDGLGYSIQLTCFMLRKKWTLYFHSITYNERSGPSKLNLIHDGLDFFKEILRERLKSLRSI